MARAPSPNQTILGEAPAFLSMLEGVSRAAAITKPVLVIGERGTGKELIAERLHYLSPRWDEPLIKLNCAALTESILESELFGHEAGAFTGASRRHIGRFERAHQGTLILDELGTIPPRMQEKILRVIEYGEFERVGGDTTVNVDTRIVGATNEDLPAKARRGEFRADLLDRLAFDVITIPPLRARQEDIPLLANHFAVNITSELGRAYFPGFGEHAKRTLMDYPWPGNVRELRHVIERSVYRAEDVDAELDQLIMNPFDSPYAPAEAQPAGAAKTVAVSAAPDRPPGHSLPCRLKDHVDTLEISLLRAAMEQCRHHQKKAAAVLGLSYHQFRGLARKHGLTKEFGRQTKDIKAR